MTLQELIYWRNEAVLSFDAYAIKRFMKHWGIPIPETDAAFWKLVRRAAREILEEEKNERLSTEEK